MFKVMSPYQNRFALQLLLNFVKFNIESTFVTDGDIPQNKCFLIMSTDRQWFLNKRTYLAQELVYRLF